MVLHESQSRLYENLVGRSWGFWRFFYPRLQAAFPHFVEVPLESFYRAINRVRPSFIRVEADEVTYGLHIILRFELEKELVTGNKRLIPAFQRSRSGYDGIDPWLPPVVNIAAAGDSCVQ